MCQNNIYPVSPSSSHSDARYHQITLNVIKNFPPFVPHTPERPLRVVFKGAETSYAVVSDDSSPIGNNFKRHSTGREDEDSFYRKKDFFGKWKKPRIVHILIEWIIQFEGKFTSLPLQYGEFLEKRDSSRGIWEFTLNIFPNEFHKKNHVCFMKLDLKWDFFYNP